MPEVSVVCTFFLVACAHFRATANCFPIFLQVCASVGITARLVYPSMRGSLCYLLKSMPKESLRVSITWNVGRYKIRTTQRYPATNGSSFFKYASIGRCSAFQTAVRLICKMSCSKTIPLESARATRKGGFVSESNQVDLRNILYF